MGITTFFFFFFCVPSYKIISGVHHFGDIFEYVTVLQSHHRGSHIPSSWMVYDGFVFATGIHPSRTDISGFCESARWNACVQRLDLSLYSHPKVFWEWSQNLCLLQGKNPLYLRLNHLVGLVVRRPPQERKVPGWNPACAGIFSGSSHTSDLNIGTSVATLTGASHYRVSAGTGRPIVSILWLGEMESFICSFYLSVAARKIVCADPSLRYTCMLLGR